MVTGTIDGASVPTNNTVAVVGPLVDTFGAFTTNGVVVTVSNVDGLCSVEQHGSNPPNATHLLIFASSPGDVGPGTYPILGTFPPEATFGALLYGATNAECHPIRSADHVALGGSIVLSRVDSVTVDGSFDVTLDSGERLSGTFTAPVCDASDAAPPMACGN
jgi:hypothetical protein